MTTIRQQVCSVSADEGGLYQVSCLESESSLSLTLTVLILDKIPIWKNFYDRNRPQHFGESVCLMSKPAVIRNDQFVPSDTNEFGRGCGMSHCGFCLCLALLKDVWRLHCRLILIHTLILWYAAWSPVLQCQSRMHLIILIACPLSKSFNPKKWLQRPDQAQ